MVMQCMDADTLDICHDGHVIVSNCIIDEINLVGENCVAHIEISNCIIGKLNIYGAWFEGGLSLTDSIILSPIDYQAGGHNHAPIILRRNIFRGFVSFFDCHFEDLIIVENNIFLEGSDILAKENEAFDNIFSKGIDVVGNIGRLDIDQLCVATKNGRFAWKNVKFVVDSFGKVYLIVVDSLGKV